MRLQRTAIKCLEREAKQHVAYRDEGDGPAILLLHGLGTTAESYDTLTATLVDQGYRVLRPDLRGHGRSDTGFSAWDVASLTADALAVLDKAAVSQAVVAGNSLGGDIAIRLAAQHPKRVAGLVLVNSGGYVEDGNLSARLLTGPLGRLLLSRSLAPRLWTGYLPKLYPTGGGKKAGLSRAAANLAQPGHGVSLWRISRLLPVSRAVTERLIPKIHQPVFVLVGERDPEFGAYGPRFARDLPHARLLGFPDLGHYPHEEAPERVTPAVLDFLGEVARR